MNLIVLFTFYIIFLLSSVSSQENDNVTKAVIEEVVADQGGAGNCPWSPAEMKGMSVLFISTFNQVELCVSDKILCNALVSTLNLEYFA